MNKMLVEINGTGTHNRGAELMALAIATRLRKTSPGIRLAVGAGFGTVADRMRYGFLTSDDFSGFRSRLVTRIASDKFLNDIGLVRMRDGSAILDASGFAFSDTWGTQQVFRLLKKIQTASGRNKKLVFLPQAFGPFDRPDVAAACTRLFERADLIYARDRDSFTAVEKLGSFKALRLCPDFTIALHGRLPDALKLPDRFAAIVPNARMLDKTEDREGRGYFRCLQQTVLAFRDASLNPVIVLHDAAEDRKLLPQLFAETGPLPVLESSDPLVLKGILGRAHVVFASRFHALVGSLSQAVPCIGVGWSHKYHWLFHDFGCPENLIQNSTSVDQLRDVVSRLCSEGSRQELIERLQVRTSALREQVEIMWHEVEACLELGPVPQKNPAPVPASPLR